MARPALLRHPAVRAGRAVGKLRPQGAGVFLKKADDARFVDAGHRIQHAPSRQGYRAGRYGVVEPGYGPSRGKLKAVHKGLQAGGFGRRQVVADYDVAVFQVMDNALVGQAIGIEAALRPPIPMVAGSGRRGVVSCLLPLRYMETGGHNFLLRADPGHILIAEAQGSRRVKDFAAAFLGYDAAGGDQGGAGFGGQGHFRRAHGRPGGQQDRQQQ